MLCQLCGGDTRLAKITVCCRGNPRDKRLEIVGGFRERSE